VGVCGVTEVCSIGLLRSIEVTEWGINNKLRKRVEKRGEIRKE
jgi:hypothetical protein